MVERNRSDTKGNDMISWLGGTRLGLWSIRHLISPLQRWIYLSTGGKLGTTISPGRNVLLLTTTGRRSGQARTTPVFYLLDGNSIVICNAHAGYERPNPWVINLRAHPRANLQIGQDIRPYQAREATDAEIQHLWPRLLELWPAYQTYYQQGGQRTIFILNRV